MKDEGKKIITTEEDPSIIGDWISYEEYIIWKEFIEEQKQKFEDFIYGRLQ